MGDTTVVDPRESQQQWDRDTEQRHRFRLSRHFGWILEAENLHFHHDSAVFLPEYETVDTDRSGEKDHINGLAILSALYSWMKDHSDHTCIIVGHTDTSGGEKYNLKLSQERAQSVLAALTGDRDEWVRIALDKGKVEDYQIMLQWVSRTWGWA